MNKSKKKPINTIAFMLIVAIIIVVSYFFLSNRSKTENKDNLNKNEIDTLLTKDMEKDYPETPKEVVKLYSRFIKCLYNDSLTDEQINDLSKQMRFLFEKELLVNNPQDAFLGELMMEIEEYKLNKKAIVSYVVERGSAIEYKEIEGSQYATLHASYMIREGSDYSKTYEQFILRQDETEKWRILGFKEVEPLEIKD